MSAKLRVLFFVLIFNLIVFPGYSAVCKERFILHFDVNETLIASDQATGKSSQDNINRALANKYKEKWSENIAEPISYKDYVYQYLIPNNPDDAKLKEKRLEKLFHFVDFIKASEYPIKKDVLADYQLAMSKLDPNESVQVFPSFFVMIQELKKENIPFTIQIRTFGHDLDAVAQVIRKKVGTTFFGPKARFENQKLFVDQSCEPKASAKSIYEFFKCQSTAVQDNWKEWDEHHELAAYGKMFPIDLEDPQTISIFFDDNIRTEDPIERNIVAPVEAQSGEQLPISTLIETNNLVVVDMLQAILDDQYFIKKINAARAPSLKQKRLELLQPVEQYEN